LEELRAEIAKLTPPQPSPSGREFQSEMSKTPLPLGEGQGVGLEDQISTIHNNLSKRKKKVFFIRLTM
jgi:hypothetical protein